MARKKINLEKGNYPPEVFEEIRFRAYQLWEQRGGVHGFDVQDWLQAEQEIIAKYSSSSNPKSSPKKKATRTRKSTKKK